MNQHRARADAADTSSPATMLTWRPAVTDMTADLDLTASERATANPLDTSRQARGCSP
jgi:hypothetical protein